MAVRPIVTVPEKVLSEKAQEIANIDDDILKLAQDMIETMYKAPGIGLAANQVGEKVQLVVVDVEYAYGDPKTRKQNPIVIINPEIHLTEGEGAYEEGCLSVPEFSIEIIRPEQIQVKGVDLQGNPIQIETDGILARALQHEIDHINGVTVLDHASVLKRNLYKKRLKKKARSD
jgi:peptide deformylase